MANANRKASTPAKSTGAPSKVSSETFDVGANVLLNNGSTDNKDVKAVVEKYAAGWYVLKLENGKTQSARAGSLRLDPNCIDGEDFFQSARSEPAERTELGEDTAAAGEDDDGGSRADESGEDDDENADLDALDAALSVAQRMAEALRKARTRYAKTRRPMGGASADCGDQIAKELREYEPDEVARLADAVLGVPVGTHFTKYGHLNNGQIRMNSGNRIRGYYKDVAERAAENNKGAIIELERLNKLLNLVEIDEEADDEQAELDDAE